jgi:hypothetical protein
MDDKLKENEERKTKNEEKYVNSPLMTPIVSEWLDFFSG